MRLLIVCFLFFAKSSFANIDQLRAKFKVGEALIGLHLHGQSEENLRTRGFEIIEPDLDQYFEALKFGQMNNDDPRELKALWTIFNKTVPAITEYTKGPHFNYHKFLAWIFLLRDFTINYKPLTEYQYAAHVQAHGTTSTALQLLSLEERANIIRTEFNKLVDPCNESLK